VRVTVGKVNAKRVDRGRGIVNTPEGTFVDGEPVEPKQPKKSKRKTDKG